VDRMSESVSLLDQETRDRLEALRRYFMEHGGSDAMIAGQKAVAAIAGTVNEQATIMAFGDAFFVLAATLLLSLATVAVWRRPTAGDHHRLPPPDRDHQRHRRALNFSSAHRGFRASHLRGQRERSSGPGEFEILRADPKLQGAGHGTAAQRDVALK